MPWLLYSQGKSPPPSTHWVGALVVPQPVWMWWYREKSQSLPGIGTLVIQPIA